MITVSDTVATALTSPVVIRSCAVESWRAGTLLADDVPIVNGTEEGDRSNRVPHLVTLTVPRTAGGVRWDPGRDEDHPLASNGQQLHVNLGVGTAAGSKEYFQRGVFLIVDTQPDGETVTVTCKNLLALVDEARLASPFQPSGTLGSTLRGLIEPGMTVDLTDAPTDRSVPTSGINWDEDRLGAVLELLDAWAADATVTEGGQLQVSSALAAVSSVATLTDGAGGTVVRANGSSSRDGGFNVVVARGTASDGGQLLGTAYDTVSNRAYGGTWSPYPVPYFYASPLLTTTAQCTDAARTILARLLRTAGASYTVSMRPDPTLELGDGVTLVTDAFTGLCTIEASTLPYVGGSGAQTLTVREVLS